MADPFALTPFRDPGDSTMFADLQKIRKIRQANELQRQQEERAAAFQLDFNNMMESGINSKSMSRMFMKYPEMSKKYAEAFKGVREDELKVHRMDLGRVTTLLDSGANDLAVKELESIADKYKNSGMESESMSYRNAAQALARNPMNGKLYINGLYTAIDPDAAIKAQEALGEMADTEKTGVETEFKKGELGAQEKQLATKQEQAEADLAKTKAERKSKELSNKKALLDLTEAQKNVGKIPKEVRAMNAPILDSMKKTAVDFKKADKLLVDLPDFGGGTVNENLRRLGKWWSGGGKADAWRQQLESFKLVDMLRNKPPGALSEGELAVLQQGVPSRNDGPEVVMRYLDAARKAISYSYAYDRMAVKFNEANGGLGSAQQDMNILDERVYAGETMPEFAARLGDNIMKYGLELSKIPGLDDMPKIDIPDNVSPEDKSKLEFLLEGAVD